MTALTVTEPGLYPDMDEADYHRDPVPGGSLSSTGARKLLPPKTPAHYNHDRQHPPASNADFDLGKAFHTRALGTGSATVVIDAKNWQTKAAKEARDAAYAAGKIPLLTHQDEQVQAMVDAVRKHRLAAALLDPTAGQPEVSAFWRDPRTGVWRRARFDMLRPREVVDLKSCDAADAENLARSVHRWGYHQQAAYYLDAVRDLGHCADPAFLFVAVEKQPPHLVHVVQLDEPSLARGDELNRQAIDRFAECQATGIWPGHPEDITTISLPPYALRDQEF